MRFMLILLFVIIGSQIVDISINKIYLFTSSSQFPTNWNILTFIIVAIVYVAGQHFVLDYVKRSTGNLKTKEKLHFPIIHKTVRVIQYVLIGVLLVVTLQMIVIGAYNTVLLEISLWIHYTLAIFMLGILARRFFYWFVNNRNTIVLFYGLATTFMGIMAGISLVLSTLLLIGQPGVTYQLAGLEEANIRDNLMPLAYALIISSIISFTITWTATVLVLRHYSKKLGRVRYWIIVSIPLVYFLSQFQPLLSNLLSSYTLSHPFLFSTIYTIVFSVSKPGGGILFATTFWSIATKISGKHLKEYMILSAIGLALIFGSEQAIILADRPYPPFGLATISFFGLSAYLLLVGIYSSAISVSEDSNLRRSIRNFARKRSKIFRQHRDGKYRAGNTKKSDINH